MQNDTREQIKAYMERVFSQAPCTQKAIEMKEAILADVLEKYDDMITDGISPQDAYHRAIGSIGDLNKLISDLRANQSGFRPPQSAVNHPEQHSREPGCANSSRRSVLNSINSALWMLVLVCYFLISFATHAWHATWVIFLIGGALSNIVRAIFDLAGGDKK